MENEQIELIRKTLAIVSVMTMMENEEEYEDRYVSPECVRRNLFIYYKIEMTESEVEQILIMGAKDVGVFGGIGKLHSDGAFREKYRLGFTALKDLR